MDFVSMIARILGGVILFIWIFSTMGARRTCRVQGNLMWATIFQFAILPFIVGVALLISGNFLGLLLGILAWILSSFFPKFFMFIFPLGAGWGLGRALFSYREPLPAFWHYASGPVGLTTMFIICTIVTAIVTTPPGRFSKKEMNLKIINRLDEILKKLSIVLLGIYSDEFPSDPREKVRQKAGTLLNELVVEELRGDQVEFKANHARFVNEEKLRLLEIEEVRKGILSFLIAKGALYSSWGHKDADIWLGRAKELDPSVEIPSTLQEISEVIENCLSYYEI